MKKNSAVKAFSKILFILFLMHVAFSVGFSIVEYLFRGIRTPMSPTGDKNELLSLRRIRNQYVYTSVDWCTNMFTCSHTHVVNREIND